jgi:multidrug resistance efflux pump
MLKTLRKRPPANVLVTEKRIATNRAGRIVYLMLLLGLGAAVLNYLFGDLVIMRADGLILRNKSVIAATYVARVESIDVREGQEVTKGDVLLDLLSTEMLDRLADLSSRRAQLSLNSVELNIRSEQVSQLLPLAEKRAAQSGKILDKFDELSVAGLVTQPAYDNAMSSNYKAQQDRISLTTQGHTLAQQLAELQAAKRDADTALSDLKNSYDKGVVYSPVSGQIGAFVPSPGDVYRPGDPILSVFWGEPYVMAYLPSRYLFAIRRGMKVRVADGRNESTGVIEDILAVTEGLPKEFQNTFKPLDRSQLARIRFSGPVPFPLHQKVLITLVY